MSSLRYGGQHASRRAVILLIIGLAVAASVFLAATAWPHRGVTPTNPAVPLIGTIDRAKAAAAAAAANRATGQPNGQPGLLVPNGGPGDPVPGEINPYRP